MARRRSWLRRLVAGTPPRGRWTLARRSVQALILTLFATQLLVGGAIVTGSLASSRLLGSVPLTDPVAFLESMVASKGLAEPERWLGLGVVAAVYVVLGRAFCGWVCPLEALFSLLERRGAGTRKRARARLESVAPGVVLASAVLLSALVSMPVFTSFSPVASLTKLASFAAPYLAGVEGLARELMLGWAAFVALPVLLNTIADWVLGVKRLWCRYVCPIGWVYGRAFNRLSPVKVRKLAGGCARCGLCSAVCPMAVDVESAVHEHGRVTDVRCIKCGRCVEACPKGLLSLAPPLGRWRGRACAAR